VRAPPALAAEHLAEALRRSPLFSCGPREAILACHPSREADGRAWAALLVERGLLTAIQAEQFLAGQGESLLVGPYRILDLIGSGGMGRVFKAEHPLMRRVVAIKILAPHLLADGESLAAFHREVEVAARLTHPNIVTAYDAAEWHGLHCLVMEYVEGTDLGRRVEQQGPLPVPLACEVVRQAALGLQHAHECNLVHCDIKPANLLVRHAPAALSASASGFEPPLVKILDFGLAGVPQPGVGAGGTPDYMAPEREVSGRAVDIRSDLYSLGCTFYYALTGQVPYPGDSWAEKLLHHQFDLPTPVRALRPEVPVGIAAIVEKLMAKDPVERFATPADLATCLQTWLATQGHARATRQPSSSLIRTPPAADGITWHDAGSHDSNVAVQAPAPSLSAAATDHLPVSVMSGTQPRPLQRRPFAVLAAMAAGLLLAFLARPLVRPASEADRAEPFVPTLTNYVTLARDPAHVFADVPTALASARDGETVLIHGNGPFPCGPLEIGARAVSIVAAPNCRPRLELVVPTGTPSWQPFLSANRPLHLEGLVLTRQGAESTGSSDTAHLVYTSGASLQLLNCEILAPHGRALVVCRDTKTVELRNCRLLADTSAVCIELGSRPMSNVVLADNTVTVLEPHGAALSLWETAGRRPAPVRLSLEHNTVRGGRILALAQPIGGLEVTGRDNAFLFRDALFDGAGAAGLASSGLETVSRGPAR
jgi:serine/threonine-protein kinase